MNKPANDFWTDARIDLYEHGRENGLSLKQAIAAKNQKDASQQESLLAEFQAEIEAGIAVSVLELADVQYEIATRTEDYDVLDSYTFEQSYVALSSNCNSPFGWRSTPDYSDKEVDELKMLSRKWKIEITPKRDIPIWLDNRINDELAYIGSDHRLFSGMSGKHRAIIFGPCTEHKDDFGFNCMRYLEEPARTPVAANVIPAYSVPGTYVVRPLSCEFARDAKYMPWITDELKGRTRPSSRANTLAKAQDLMNREIAKYYVQKHGSDRGAISKELLEDIELQALLFCRGQLIHHRHLSVENVGMITAARLISDTNCGNIAALAECCVETGGPLFEFMQLAQTDPDKARLHLLMFLSDFFYVDSPQLMEQTELFLTAFIPAIKADGLDSAWFNRALEWLQEYTETDFAAFLTELSEGIMTAKHYIRETDEVISHELIEQQVAIHIRSGDAEEGEQPFATSVASWSSRINVMSQLAEDDYANMIVRILEFRKATDQALIESLFPTWQDKRNGLKPILHEQVLPQLIAGLTK